MVTVTIDISAEDETEVLDLARSLAHSGMFGRLKHATRLIEWVFAKKARGLTVERRGADAWHVSVPRG